MSKSLEERASGLAREASFKPLEYDTTGLINTCLQLIVDQAAALIKVKAQSLANGKFICKQRNQLTEAQGKLKAVEDAEKKAEELIFGRFGFLTLGDAAKVINHSHVGLIEKAFQEIRKAIE